MTHHVSYLGLVDLDLGSSLVWWATVIVNSTQVRDVMGRRGEESLAACHRVLLIRTNAVTGAPFRKVSQSLCLGTLRLFVLPRLAFALRAFTSFAKARFFHGFRLPSSQNWLKSCDVN